MKNRITHISDSSYLDQNLKTLFRIFTNNSYPKRILNIFIYNSNIFDGPTDNGCPDNFTYEKLHW